MSYLATFLTALVTSLTLVASVWADADHSFWQGGRLGEAVGVQSVPHCVAHQLTLMQRTHGQSSSC
jgi:hypothetical protein